MRILHTSDWHLGRTFHRESLLDGQAAFVDHLVETVREERVDVVLVAADVYDRALPPVAAVALCHDALHRLREPGARTIPLHANHDPARRRGPAPAPTEAPGARRPWELTERTPTAALTYAMDRIRAAAARHRHAVVLAHAFVTGGAASDSERDISVGGVAHVPLTTFAGVDYVALGHLHGRQRMSETVRYSGSPLAYSFSEAGQVKGSWLVTLGSGAEFVPAPVPRPVGRISGRLDDLLTSPRYADVEDHWLQVVLTDPERPRAAMDRLRARFPHTLALSFEPEG